jgi:protein TonB
MAHTLYWYRLQPSDKRRLVGLASALALHLGVAWLLLSGSARLVVERVAAPVLVTILDQPDARSRVTLTAAPQAAPPPAKVLPQAASAQSARPVLAGRSTPVPTPALPPAQTQPTATPPPLPAPLQAPAAASHPAEPSVATLLAAAPRPASVLASQSAATAPAAAPMLPSAGTANERPAAPIPQAAAPISGNALKDLCPHTVKAVPPARAARSGQGGMVLARATIKGGKVRRVEILKSDPDGLYDAAVRAAMAQYVCRDQGEVEVLAEQLFEFKLVE